MRKKVNGYVSIAPMIDKTDRHFRHFLRLLTREAVLYTEMITTGAILHGRKDQLLGYNDQDHPLILQVGGDDPEQMYQAIRIAEDWGYDEYNLNVGCPSDKVQKGSFGACLMATPARVVELLEAMHRGGTRPVGVKHRVGIQSSTINQTSYGELHGFVEQVSKAPVDRFIVHARIAILEGLSPKENRSVPPLRYEDVWQLKKDFPDLHLEINGNIKTLEDMRLHQSKGMDGVMVGRMSYENPWELSKVDGAFTDGKGEVPVHIPGSDELADPGRTDLSARFDVALAYAGYVDAQVEQGHHPRSLIWPILELFPGIRGARRYKQVLSVPFGQGIKVTDLVRTALGHLEAARN